MNINRGEINMKNEIQKLIDHYQNELNKAYQEKTYSDEDFAVKSAQQEILGDILIDLKNIIEEN